MVAEQKSTARFQLPLVAVLRGYDRSWLSADVVAGLTLWGLVVPESMAYASIAGLPAQAGLYTVLVTLAVYALFGSSRHLVVGPTSATAALLASTVVALSPADAVEYASFAAVAVIVVGLVFVLASFARLGFIAQFLSRPVMEGFVVGLAIFVAVGQLNKLFGVSKGSGNVPRKLWHVITELDHANWVSFAVGIGALVLLFVLPRLSRRLPSGLVVLALAIVVSSVLDLAGRHDVDVVGVLPKGLPGLASLHIRLDQFWTLIPAAVGIVLVAFSEALGVADNFANRHQYEIDPNQELFAYGAANLVSGALGGLVGCGGMSSTAVNDGAGAKTEVSGLVTTAMVFVTVIALTPLFKNLPEAVLGALIIHAVSHMMKVDKLRAVRRMARAEFWLGITALLGVVLFDVLQGLVIAMAASILLVLYRSSKPSVEPQGLLPDADGEFGALERNPGAATWPGVLVVDHDAPIYYANAASNRDATKALVNAAEPPIDTVVYLTTVLHQLDVTSIESFEQMLTWFATRDIEVFVVRPHKDLLLVAERAGLLALIDEDHTVADVAEALARRRHR